MVLQNLLQGLVGPCIPAFECPGGYIELEELSVHNVDHGGDDVLHELGAEGKRGNVICWLC